jgi:endonuclease-3
LGQISRKRYYPLFFQIFASGSNITMTRKEKAKLIQLILDQLFPKPMIPLDHRDHYTLLIAVLLSARSTDAQVNRITPKLFAIADTPQKMVKLKQEEIREVIKPCGLSPQKSRAILELSKILLEKHAGHVPESFTELKKLPGVGQKTASVVMAQAFGHDAFPIDTHIQRSAVRWGLSKSKSVVQVERDLKKIFPKKCWSKLHLQIIHFARRYCPARGHKKENCPICSLIET